MPFSFKPEISQGDPNGAPASPPSAESAPAASFGSSVQNLMNRETPEGHSAVQFFLMGLALLTLLVCVVLIGYKFYLSSQIENKKAVLASYESRLAGFPLEDMRKLSNRIRLINQLVKEHPSVNVAFRILEDSIENPVTYTRFDLRYNESTKSYQLNIGAIAPNYRGVAQQVDTYKRKPYTNYLSSVSVEGLQPTDRGSVEFSLKMPIMIAGLLPEELNLSDGAAALIASSSPQTASSTPQTATSSPQGNGTSTPQ